MPTSERLGPSIPSDPTRCYIEGCDAENELVLHVADDPWCGTDVCHDHARRLVDDTALIWGCDCAFCERARRLMTAHEHREGVVLCIDCMGRWLMRTASGSSYLLDLDEKTAQRIQGSTNADPERAFHFSQPLRRDGDALPLVAMEPVRLRESAFLLLSQVDDYEGYVNTTRMTTPVTSVEEMAGD